MEVGQQLWQPKRAIDAAHVHVNEIDQAYRHAKENRPVWLEQAPDLTHCLGAGEGAAGRISGLEASKLVQSASYP